MKYSDFKNRRAPEKVTEKLYLPGISAHGYNLSAFAAKQRIHLLDIGEALL